MTTKVHTDPLEIETAVVGDGKKPAGSGRVIKEVKTEFGKQPIHPVGWRILIRDYQFEEKTAGGLFLPDTAKDAQEHLNYIGQVVELGSFCYQSPKFGGGDPWCKESDWVVFGRYAGQKVVLNETEEIYRFINDMDVLAVADDPNKLKVYL